MSPRSRYGIDHSASVNMECMREYVRVCICCDHASADSYPWIYAPPPPIASTRLSPISSFPVKDQMIIQQLTSDVGAMMALLNSFETMMRFNLTSEEKISTIFQLGDVISKNFQFYF